MNAVWLLGALGLAVLAQELKATSTLLSVPFWLDLAAVIILSRQLPGPSSDATPIGRTVAPGRKPTATALVLVAVGAVAALACSAGLLVAWSRGLLTVLCVGPAALLCLAVGLDVWFGYGDGWRWSAVRLGAIFRRPAVQLLILIVLVGVLFRFVSLGFFPPMDGFESIEETQAGTGAKLILDAGSRPWEWPLSWYLTAATFKIFGASMYALRVPMIIMGCLTLLPFYLLLREITAAPAALFATALLAVSRWHVQVSWYNDPVFVPLLPVVIVLYLLLRTQRVRRPSLYVAIGALCGYLLYDYAAFRIIPAVVFAFYLGAAWRARGLPPEWRQLVVLGGVLALFALPLAGIISRVGAGAYVESLGRAFANKDYYTTDVHSFVEQRWQRARLASDAFTVTDHEAFLETLNPRGAPLLDPFTSVAFVLGFGTTLLQLRRRYHLFFAGTFVLLVIGATILVQQLDFRRLAILIPFVFVFVALLADKLDVLASRSGRQHFLYAAFAFVAVLAGGYSYHFLFRVLARDPRVRTFHRDSYTVPAFYLRQHYHGEYVVLLTSEAQNFFLANDYDWIKPDGLEGQTVTDAAALQPIAPTPPAGREVVVLIEWPFAITDVVQHASAFYPGAACEVRHNPDGSRWDLGVCRIAPGLLSH
jgi:Ca2+/Na+ antiporter